MEALLHKDRRRAGSRLACVAGCRDDECFDESLSLAQKTAPEKWVRPRRLPYYLRGQLRLQIEHTAPIGRT
jgi:hypothetical protein